MSDQTDRIIKIIPIVMNEISPTFCMAKWYHSGIYFHTGQTHSCYHPKPHAIDVSLLATNPSALHNTPIKKQERAMMLVGEKPKGCQYCWNVESLSDTHMSDRMIRNNSLYTPERMEEIKTSTWQTDVTPEYIEVAFSNECNFKCGYCHPMSSSAFQNEIKKFGPYDMVKNHRLDIDWFTPIQEDENPYIKAWWEWWPELSKTLNILRITGGEPLTHKSTWKLIERLEQDPRPQLELNINSNLGVKPHLVERISEAANSLKANGKIREFQLYSSMDTWGPRAEYIRTGLKLDVWEKNLDTYITTTKGVITFMCTFNILSVTSFNSFLAKVLEWRAKYNHLYADQSNARKIRFDTPYLKEPLQYDMNILPIEYLVHFDNILKFIDDNRDDSDPTKFSDYEYEKFRRVRDYFATANYSEEKVRTGRIDFYNWFTEYDRRRKTNFLETFPDMVEFWEMCKSTAKSSVLNQ